MGTLQYKARRSKNSCAINVIVRPSPQSHCTGCCCSVIAAAEPFTQSPRKTLPVFLLLSFLMVRGHFRFGDYGFFWVSKEHVHSVSRLLDMYCCTVKLFKAEIFCIMKYFQISGFQEQMNPESGSIPLFSFVLLNSLTHSNPIQGRTGSMQGTTRFENRFLAMWSRSLYWEHIFPVIKVGFPCENLGTGNTCFHYRDRVFSVNILFSPNFFQKSSHNTFFQTSRLFGTLEY